MFYNVCTHSEYINLVSDDGYNPQSPPPPPLSPMTPVDDE